MKVRAKKTLSLLMALVMLISMFPVSAFATEDSYGTTAPETQVEGTVEPVVEEVVEEPAEEPSRSRPLSRVLSPARSRAPSLLPNPRPSRAPSPRPSLRLSSRLLPRASALFWAMHRIRTLRSSSRAISPATWASP